MSRWRQAEYVLMFACAVALAPILFWFVIELGRALSELSLR